MEGKTILLVDDDKVFLDTLNRALEKREYRVLAAESRERALALAGKHIPDYAVIDLKIDRDSGLDCLQPLMEINPAIRMLILTGYSSIATAVSAIKKGAVDYACKPLDVNEILAILVEGKRANAPVAEDPVSVERLQWEHIQRVLDDNNGNISATARSLGMHRRTLQRKLSKRPVRR